MFRTVNLLMVLVSFVLLVSSGLADPGTPDSVIIDPDTLILGRSTPLSFTIVNDETVWGYSLGLILSSTDGGYAEFDSAVYINRMADPSVMTYRISNYRDGGPLLDTLFMGANRFGVNPGMPPGNDQIAELYFTGVSLGQMAVDSGYIPPAGPFKFSTDQGGVLPQFSAGTIHIVEGTLPPSVTITDSPPPDIVGNEISFEIEAESPEEFPVSISFDALTAYDDESVQPETSPEITGENPMTFSWDLTQGDIGIWRATFTACDSAGLCTSKEVTIQVLESDEFMVDFETFETSNSADVTGMCHGNFDSDEYLELFTAGTSNLQSPILELYDFNEISESWVRDYDSTSGSPQFGPQTGFFNDDSYLDVVTMGYYDGGNYDLAAFLGDGDNGFEIYSGSIAGHTTRISTMGELTGDKYLDYACNYWDGVWIYQGTSGAGFAFHSMIPTSDSALTVMCADFDSDGNDDLAIGTSKRLEIHLGDGNGAFDHVVSYDQTYGSFDIEVTNKGSDFNNDDIYDLCMTSPSIGGEFSDMYVYLGNGDGTFQQQLVGTFLGQVWANCVGDFNGDNELDIAFTNGSKEYVSLLFGNGDGTFTNEIRHVVPHPMPQKIDCFDVDLDGDLDIVVAANGALAGYSIYTYLNQMNPGGYDGRSVQISAQRNADIELESSSGKVLNKMKSTMPSGDYYRRNLDQDNTIDAFVTTHAIESDQYILSATPRPNLPAGEAFSLEFSLDGSQYRLAKDVPMNVDGYAFNIYTGYSCPVHPRPGKFTAANPPTFNWLGEGQYVFELASDIDFTDVVVSDITDGSSYTAAAQLPMTDTTSYYWRIKPVGQAEFDCRYVVNLILGSGAAPGDVDGSGDVDMEDIVFLINYIFFSGSPPDPFESGDVDCSGDVDIDDAVWLILYLFLGGNAPNDTDGDDVPDC